jgi:hypothetical protein
MAVHLTKRLLRQISWDQPLGCTLHIISSDIIGADVKYGSHSVTNHRILTMALRYLVYTTLSTQSTCQSQKTTSRTPGLNSFQHTTTHRSLPRQTAHPEDWQMSGMSRKRCLESALIVMRKKLLIRHLLIMRDRHPGLSLRVQSYRIQYISTCSFSG